MVVASGSAQSSDVASANYVARRQYGIRNGMWLASARKCCPALVVLPLEFAVYERKSTALFNVLNNLGADLVYPVSVDEAVVDVSGVVYEQSEQRGVPLEEAVAALQLPFETRVREAAADRSQRGGRHQHAARAVGACSCQACWPTFSLGTRAARLIKRGKHD